LFTLQFFALGFRFKKLETVLAPAFSLLARPVLGLGYWLELLSDRLGLDASRFFSRILARIRLLIGSGLFWSALSCGVLPDECSVFASGSSDWRL